MNAKELINNLTEVRRVDATATSLKRFIRAWPAELIKISRSRDGFTTFVVQCADRDDADDLAMEAEDQFRNIEWQHTNVDGVVEIDINPNY